MLARQTAPVLGAQLGPYLEPGEWQLGATYRWFRADDQYQGTRINRPVMRLGANVITKLQLLDLSATYAVNQQCNLTLSVPILVYGSSSRALPANVAGSPRFVHSAEGLGDIVLTARYWLLDCQTHQDQNIALGLGVKFPTGQANAMDRFPNALGQDSRLRPVDQSIQPGDGSWGVVLDLQAFKQVGSLTLFAQGTYLINPREENRTLSPRSLLSPTGPSAVPRDQRFNTVADQYLARVGVTHPVPRAKGLSLLLAARMEGVPVEDLFGGNSGFRRPGYVISVEPGIIYTTGATTFSFSAPVATQVNVQPQANGVVRDSTFADVIFLASVTHRFGRGK